MDSSWWHATTTEEEFRLTLEQRAAEGEIDRAAAEAVEPVAALAKGLHGVMLRQNELLRKAFRRICELEASMAAAGVGMDGPADRHREWAAELMADRR